MQPYQQRVIAETIELNEKIFRLNMFIHSDLFQSLIEDEKHRMLKQMEYMEAYSSVLGERIEAFWPPGSELAKTA